MEHLDPKFRNRNYGMDFTSEYPKTNAKCLSEQTASFEVDYQSYTCDLRALLRILWNNDFPSCGDAGKVWPHIGSTP